MFLYKKDHLLDQDKLHISRIRPRNDELHGHTFLELVYVMGGSALHQLGAETSRVSAGDYFIVDFGSGIEALVKKDTARWPVTVRHRKKESKAKKK